MGVFFKNPFVGQDLYFVYFGLSRTLTESNRPRIFTEEVLHMKEQYQCKGQARDRARANIGPTMRPSFLAALWDPLSPTSVASFLRDLRNR
jgi:hypothetical protein